jgi:hypothetical protein
MGRGSSRAARKLKLVPIMMAIDTAKQAAAEI